MRFSPSVFALIALGMQQVRGHSDDVGDVHPWVHVEEDQFGVYFRNNVSDGTFKTTVTSDGRIISLREPSLFPELPLPSVNLKESEDGINVPLEDAFYVFPEWQRKHDGKPFVMKIEDGKSERIPLEWGDLVIQEVHGAAVTNEWYILTTSLNPPSGGPRNYPFHFRSFSRVTRRMVRARVVGVPVRVYDFPRASNVVVQGPYAYVAWMAAGGQTTILQLSRFDPKTGAMETRNVMRGNWNSQPSIASIENHLLIAFHEAELKEVDGKWKAVANIATKHILLSAMFE